MQDDFLRHWWWLSSPDEAFLEKKTLPPQAEEDGYPGSCLILEPGYVNPMALLPGRALSLGQVCPAEPQAAALVTFLRVPSLLSLLSPH